MIASRIYTSQHHGRQYFQRESRVFFTPLDFADRLEFDTEIGQVGSNANRCRTTESHMLDSVTHGNTEDNHDKSYLCIIYIYESLHERELQQRGSNYPQAEFKLNMVAKNDHFPKKLYSKRCNREVSNSCESSLAFVTPATFFSSCILASGLRKTRTVSTVVARPFATS